MDSGDSPKNASGTASPRETRSLSRSSTSTTCLAVCVAREIAKGTVRWSSTIRTVTFTRGHPLAALARSDRLRPAPRGSGQRPASPSRARPPAAAGPPARARDEPGDPPSDADAPPRDRSAGRAGGAELDALAGAAGRRGVLEGGRHLPARRVRADGQDHARALARPAMPAD